MQETIYIHPCEKEPYCQNGVNTKTVHALETFWKNKAILTSWLQKWPQYDHIKIWLQNNVVLTRDLQGCHSTAWAHFVFHGLPELHQCIKVILKIDQNISCWYLSKLMLTGKNSSKRNIRWCQKTVVITFPAEGIAFTFLRVSSIFLLPLFWLLFKLRLHYESTLPIVLPLTIAR